MTKSKSHRITARRRWKNKNRDNRAVGDEHASIHPVGFGRVEAAREAWRVPVAWLGIRTNTPPPPPPQPSSHTPHYPPSLFLFFTVALECSKEMNWFVSWLFVRMCLSVCHLSIHPSLFVHTQGRREPRTKNHHPLYPPRGKRRKGEVRRTTNLLTYLALCCFFPFLHSPILLLPFLPLHTPVRQLLAGTMEQMDNDMIYAPRRICTSPTSASALA